ncbi:MAG: hypothetical protein KC613_21935, partial [Myxococcales bacterium]|nr:hypothetical protein [Myxococcales bacterium]
PAARALALYLAAVAAVFAALGWAVAAHQGELLDAALRFVLPEGWVPTAQVFAQGYVRDHLPAVINLWVSLIAVVVPAVTFPLKEIASARYERSARAGTAGWTPPPPQPPLMKQVVEEALLLVVFLALALGALRVSVTPGLAKLGGALTWVVLSVSFAVDFLGPTLVRHHVSPTDVYRTLGLRRPLHSLVFGAAWALPIWGMGKALPHLSPTVGFAALAAVNLGVFAGALLSGTLAGSRMVSAAKALRPSRFKGLGWAALLGLLLYNGAYFGGAVRAAWHATPVLKCTWRPVLSSVDWALPGLTDPSLRLRFDVEIHNPTGRTAQVGDNTVTLYHKGEAVTATRIPPFEVAPGARVTRPIALAVRPQAGLLGKAVKFAAAARRDGLWSATKANAASLADKTAYRVELALPLPTGRLVLPLYDGAGKP